MKTETMENKVNLIESLLESTIEYGKTSAELLKLRALHKTSEIVSSSIPHLMVIVVVIFFVLFISLGLAYWIGILLENLFYGFFIVGAFYGLTGLFMHLVMHKWMKRKFGDFIVKQLFK
jgi:fatty acid desaturase